LKGATIYNINWEMESGELTIALCSMGDCWLAVVGRGDGHGDWMVELLERGGVGRGAGGMVGQIEWGGVVGQLSLERPTVDHS